MENHDIDIAEPIATYTMNGSSRNTPQRVQVTAFEVKSEEVQDIMSRMPHWIIRRGTSVLFALIILLFCGAYFIHYPDVLITEINITSSQPPIKLVAQSSGKISKLFVENNQLVKKDDAICLLENPANYQDLLQLKNIVSRLDTSFSMLRTLRQMSFPKSVQLGALQSGYADLYQSVNQYLFFAEKNFIREKLGQLQSQMGYQAQLNKELQNRDVLLKQQLQLEKRKFDIDSSLVRDKVIAPLEFDNSRKVLISKQIDADATKASIIQNKLQQTEYLKTMTELQQQKLQQENDLEQRIRDNVKRIMGDIEAWELKYLIKSPTEGKAEFFKFWTINQYVSSGDGVVMIVPPVAQHIARAALPVDGAGKVKPGQKVLIKLSSYPFQEFGMIRGRVEKVSPVVWDTAYAMQIELVDGLKTTANKTIPSQPQMTGVAEVLTSDKNILQRLFEKIWVRTGE